MSSRPTRTGIALLASIALTVVACGGGDDTSSTEPADADTPVAADGEAATISIADFSFSGVTEVAVGTTVTVTNSDSTQHTWTAVDGPFDSGALGPDDTFEFTFTEAGEFDYLCNFHPSMTGTIVVTA